jgi:hypothetical protein
MLRVLFLLLLFVSPAHAWNALGHKVIAEIAWQQLTPEKQKEITDILKRHPRFGEDFRDLETNQDIFHHAAVWPDIARGIRGPEKEKYHKPIWHYVNFPYTANWPEPKLNTSDDPASNKSIAWNVLQSTKHCLSVIESDAPPQQKALAYSWLFHLVGDVHQPMHSTAIYCERFPSGDRGGNSIKLRKGDNLHSLWDNLIGRSHKPNDVKREVAQLKQKTELWEVDTTFDIKRWAEESNELAINVAYSEDILKAVQSEGDIPPIELPVAYYQQAGDVAKARVVAAGLRLGALLGGERETQPESYDFGFRPPATTPTAKQELTHWLNTNGNVRHNPSCQWFEKTKRGRRCTANEGKPCGQCGG